MSESAHPHYRHWGRDPDYLTVQAIEALNDTQVFFAMDKGESKSDLVALRRQICARFVREPGYRFVELPDPKRTTDADYQGAVADWRAVRARIWASAISAALRAAARARHGWIMDIYLLRAQ